MTTITIIATPKEAQHVAEDHRLIPVHPKWAQINAILAKAGEGDDASE